MDHLHLFTANAIVSNAMEHIFSDNFLQYEAPYHGKRVLIVPTDYPFSELLFCAAYYLAQGWEVGLYPCGSW